MDMPQMCIRDSTDTYWERVVRGKKVRNNVLKSKNKFIKLCLYAYNYMCFQQVMII